MTGISRSRGCIIKFHRAGMRVVMYVDSPGEYFDERGKPLSEQVAKEAGFDTERLTKEREKQDKLAAFRKQLDSDYSDTEDKIAEALSSGAEVKVKHIGGGQYAIFDGEKQLTKFAMNKEEAQILISGMEVGDDGKQTRQTTSAKEAPEAETESKFLGFGGSK